MTVSETKSVTFEKIGDQQFKVLGILEHMTYDAPPAPLVKDETVTFISGKFPLDDYRDTNSHSHHEYVFERADGTRVTGILEGFTVGCTFFGIDRGQSHSQQVTVQIPVTQTTTTIPPPGSTDQLALGFE
jgi:hypothetical protein